MFWYKAWLETKFKFLLALAFMTFYLFVFYLTRTTPSAPGNRGAALIGLSAATFAIILYTWLAGAGIGTQPSFQAAKGLHGSTLYTLSLPVSRLRLLAIRSATGWLEMAAGILAWCYGCWFILRLGKWVPAVDMLEYVAALTVCASSFYFLSVLLGTFAPIPESANIVRAVMGESSPLISHTLPWMAMLCSLVLAAAFFLAALKIARSREY